MKLLPARLLLALVAVVSMPALAQNIVTVNGKAIPSSRADMFVKQAATQGQADTPELRKMVKERLVESELLAQEAAKLGLAKNADVKDQIEVAQQQVMIKALIDHIKKTEFKDAELKAEYEVAKASFAGRNEVDAHHILVEKEDEAKAIIAKLKAGGKFEEWAKASKDTGSAANGGALGWADPSSYVPEFATALAALQKGKITETPVKSQFGYHVIRLNDTRPVQVPSMEDLKAQLVQGLQQKKFQALMEDLKKKAKIL